MTLKGLIYLHRSDEIDFKFNCENVTVLRTLEL